MSHLREPKPKPKPVQQRIAHRRKALLKNSPYGKLRARRHQPIQAREGNSFVPANVEIEVLAWPKL